jgi:outer membrane protein OmpA-like peptidoglycan-associated protein
MKKIKPLLLLLSLIICGNLLGQDVEIKNLKDVNSEELDFSPMPFGNGIMYTSSKSDRFLSCPVYDNSGSYVDLYYAEKNPDGTWKKPVALKGKVNGKYNDGVPAFNPTGNKMMFTRNNLNGKNDQNVIDLKIYTGELEQDNWVNVTTPLPFNSDDWSTAHPALSSDGNLLIFSSNRPGSIPGMEGKPSMDLWGSRLENGVWSIPFNLGPSVNTGKSEIFPTFNENGALFFSSDGHPGEGGLDIFAAVPTQGDEWELVGNIGTPFNTGSDDMSFIALNGGTEGYLASDRGSSDAKGRDDIYEWTRNVSFQDAVIQVVDADTREPLPNTNLSIDPGQLRNESMIKYGPVLDKIFGGIDGETLVLEPLQVKTDEEGKVTVRILSPANFNILASNKPAYIDATRNPTDVELTAEPVYVIPLTKDNPTAKLIVKVVEDGPMTPIPTPNISIRNKRTGDIITLTGDGGGEATTQIFCNDDYEIVASKELYYDNTVVLSDYKVECLKGEVVVTVPLRKQMIVYLEPIFFDFDRYYIRSRDAQPTLDELVTIMNTYPSLYVQLEGNTDSRGSNQYNVTLSTNRAKSAMKYLIKKGIAEERLSTDWFGETKLANNCADDIVCPEADHQINRRVDVVSVKDSENGIIFMTRPLSEIKVVSDRQ